MRLAPGEEGATRLLITQEVSALALSAEFVAAPGSACAATLPGNTDSEVTTVMKRRVSVFLFILFIKR
jgi:hypothetical protein